jgi:hypothetical protein
MTLEEEAKNYAYMVCTGQYDDLYEYELMLTNAKEDYIAGVMAERNRYKEKKTIWNKIKMLFQKKKV